MCLTDLPPRTQRQSRYHVGHDVAMKFDSKNLGRLRRVANLRAVWNSESGDFTPWLAWNIDVLAEALGKTLTVVGTEVQVGEFRLDIRAEDENGNVVIIESQLDSTDHGHLGRCLMYASGLDARTVISLAPQFQDDFRLALDWLNERTHLGINFFGVEVGVVQIGDGGPLAPVFDVVARPKEWQDSVKRAGTPGAISAGGMVSPTNAQRQDFFADVLAEVVAKIPAIRLPPRSRSDSISFASGPFGCWSMSVSSDGRLRIEAYLDTGDQRINKALFDEFKASRAQWEMEVGVRLDWERLDGERASRIVTYQPLDLESWPYRAAALTWASTIVARLISVLNEPLRTRATILRVGVTAIADALAAQALDKASPTEPE